MIVPVRRGEGMLGRTGRILDALAAAGRPLGYAEIKRVLGDIGEASLSRLLMALREEGILTHDGDAYAASDRTAAWAHLPRAESHPLARSLRGRMVALSERHSATVIVLERSGARIESVAKVRHTEAPLLMPVGRRFPARIPAFGCICLMRVPKHPSQAWIAGQLRGFDPPPSGGAEAILRVIEVARCEGVYRDRWLWRGQCRVAVPIRRGTRRAVLGASVPATATMAAEMALLEDLRESASRMDE